ncbi:MAG: hypothetical protein QOF36_2162 [Microbacteriaceae bacterium]|jgi:hypothetical protein|nr:hypothetical protein [Microbacteriaceae bacterium]
MSRIPASTHAQHPAIAVWRRIAALPCRSRATVAFAGAASLVVLAIGILAGILAS